MVGFEKMESREKMLRMSWTPEKEDAAVHEMLLTKPYSWGAGPGFVHRTACAGWAKLAAALGDHEKYPCFYDSDGINDFQKKVQEKVTALVVAFRVQIQVHPWRLVRCRRACTLPNNFPALLPYH